MTPETATLVAYINDAARQVLQAYESGDQTTIDGTTAYLNRCIEKYNYLLKEEKKNA